MDSRIKLFLIAAAFLIVGGASFGLLSPIDGEQSGAPKLKIEEKTYDFGNISMANGLVTHNFKITNEGDADLVLSNMKTSCMCTSAVLKVGENSSPKFGMRNNLASWSQKIAPGESAELSVTFDPNAHGPNATGPINRTISFLSNDGGKDNQSFTFTIFGTVVK